MSGMGQKIVLARLTLQLGQKDLAKLLDVHQVIISRWENNKVIPTNKNLQKLSNTLNKPISYFFEDSNTSVGDNSIGVFSNEVKNSKNSSINNNNINSGEGDSNKNLKIEDIENKLERILEMKNKNLLTEEEYQKKRKELVDQI
jgi:transcriptional regulator with XRE-family HTH domain